MRPIGSMDPAIRNHDHEQRIAGSIEPIGRIADRLPGRR